MDIRAAYHWLLTNYHGILAMSTVRPNIHEDVPYNLVLDAWVRMIYVVGRLQLPRPNPRIERVLFEGQARNFLPGIARDLWQEVSNETVWRLTGETRESITNIATDFQGIVNHRIGRNHSLSLNNRLLMVLIWLRHYPTYDLLGAMFGVSPTCVHRDIYVLVPLLWHYFKQQVRWPTIAQWLQYRGRWECFPDAVGAIDGTLHQVYRPDVEPQAEFYSGHRRIHCLSTQVIIDNEKNIRYVQSGFLGHLNDAGQFLQLPSIGPAGVLPFHDNIYLLGDKGYANRYPVLTPYRAGQLGNGLEFEARKLFNKEHSRCRVCIEHIMSFLKTYRSVKELYRHPRWLMPTVVELCAFLSQRHVTLYHDMY